MEKMGYNFKKKLGLSYEKRVRTQPLTLAPKMKDIDYYDKTRRGLGYVFDPLTSASDSDY